MNTAAIAALIVIAMAASMLTACGSTAADTAPTQPAAAPAAEAPAEETLAEAVGPDYSTGSPWMYSAVKGVIDANTPTNLKDDFFLAVNKDTIINMEYAPGSVAESNLMMAIYDVQDNKIALMKDEAPASHEGQLIHDYYLALDDWDTRTAVLEQRAAERFEKINGITNSRKMHCQLHQP